MTPVSCVSTSAPESASCAGDAEDRADQQAGAGDDVVGRGQREGFQLDLAYVDCAVERWHRFTGEVAVLEATGRCFGEVKAEREPVRRLSDTSKKGKAP